MTFHVEPIQDELALYERTQNGAHMWRCYQLWQRLMPPDLPLPPELLAYLEECAEAVAADTDPGTLKRRMRLTQPPGAMAEHGGGGSGRAAADPTRRQHWAMQFVRDELFAAELKGNPPKGYKTASYLAAAERFDYSVPHIKKLRREYRVREAVDHSLHRARAIKASSENWPRLQDSRTSA